MNDGFQAVHRLGILKDNGPQCFTINTVIVSDHGRPKFFLHLHRYRLATQVELMYNRIRIDIAFSAQLKQLMPNSSFATGNVASKTDDTWHEQLLSMDQHSVGAMGGPLWSPAESYIDADAVVH